VPRFREREGTLTGTAWTTGAASSGSMSRHSNAPRYTSAVACRRTAVPATLRRNGKRLVLFTNAHPAALAIKDERTGVSAYLDAMFSSHTFLWPKETGVLGQRAPDRALRPRAHAVRGR